jgi:plastocyanin
MSGIGSMQLRRFAPWWGALSALTSLLMTVAPQSAQAEKRFFTIAAVEPKGGTTVDKEPFPTAAVPEGGGYVIRKPDQTGRWEISAYVWQPSQIIVTQGDEVTLEFVGINGAEHPTTIVGYDKTLVLKRGHVIRIELKADKPGTFAIVCNHHKPSMVGELIVMPKK